jgi:hypothetical protein
MDIRKMLYQLWNRLEWQLLARDQFTALREVTVPSFAFSLRNKCSCPVLSFQDITVAP